MTHHPSAPTARRGIKVAILAVVLGVAAAPAVGEPPAGAPDRLAQAEGRAAVADEIVVGLRDGSERVVELAPGVRPREAIESLAGESRIRFAHRNWVVKAAVDPLDRGRSGRVRGWRRAQWNFLGKPGGVRVGRAWNRVAGAGRPGAAGVTVAVVDTGVAYADAPPRFAMSPGFTSQTSFAPGRDFVDGDNVPLDKHGHGTHLAGTIAEQVTLGTPSPGKDYLTGLAYGASVMPVRILNARGFGTSANLARGIRWAARHGADVINLSLALPRQVRRCKQVRAVCKALRVAKRNRALVVAAAGNKARGDRRRVRFPAAAPGVLAVGGSTASGCLAASSHAGKRLDLLAPGGGRPLRAGSRRRCRGDRAKVRQVTLACTRRQCPPFNRFRIFGANGTSMAAAHASGVAALVRASGAAGANPGPHKLRRWLKCSARPKKRPRLHGAGLLDAARATAPRAPRRCRR